MSRLNIKNGDKYGRFSIVKEVEKQRKDRMFLCVCDCGKEKIVQLNNLRSGNSYSCGCFLKEVLKDPNFIKINKEKQRKFIDEHKGFKGEDVCYEGKHWWITKHNGKANKCENEKCVYPRRNSKGVYIEKPKRYEWANITGEYTKNAEDYRQLCPSCHRQYDEGTLLIKFKRLEYKDKPEKVYG